MRSSRVSWDLYPRNEVGTAMEGTVTNETPIAMLAKLYALLTDAYSMDAPIYVFHERRHAETVMRMKDTGSASIISFTATDLLSGATHGLIYLAMSLEDTGIRIHAAFRNMFSLRSYLLDHIEESACVQGVGWLDPVIKNGKVLELFDLGHPGGVLMHA
jgi:hypothetical protein